MDAKAATVKAVYWTIGKRSVYIDTATGKRYTGKAARARIAKA